MRLESLIWTLLLLNGYCYAKEPAVELFLRDGVPEKWVVTEWSDLKKPAPEGVVWRVKDGVLHGSQPRGTWLMSEAEYDDFVFKFEWKLGERGNSGVALRAPMQGDPAFDGLELQMVDPRYFPEGQTAQPDELSGSLYRAAAPKEQAFRPTQWNTYEITCQGPRVKVVLNGVLVQDLNLDEQTKRPQRHDGSLAPPLKDRPRRGHVGFQELSRGENQVQIRGAQLRTLDKSSHD